MGRSYTPKYAIVMDDGKGPQTFAWDVKRHGKATDANLQKWCEAYGTSLNPGGVNAHIRNADGTIPYPRKAIIKHNSATGAIVAMWKVAMFMVWE